jgi:glycosyltransferase involved in cell wall biosynthesis
MRRLTRAIRKRAATLANARRSPAVPHEAPLVSVIIATYNWSSVLRYAIRTALWQTYTNIEVLVIGDACTDDSEQVAHSFGDPRVRWHNLAENSGNQTGPNRVGLELARGEYVAYLGHDDLWLPTHLAWLMEAVAETGAPLAHTYTEWIGPDGSYRAVSGMPPSAILHETGLGREIGWRDYREIVEGPDYDFIGRASGRAGTLKVPVLTVFKFPSAWRKNSYVEKPSHEQAAYVRRIESERGFIYRELAALQIARFRPDRWPGSVFDENLPDPVPPGWRVTQYRKARGLE